MNKIKLLVLVACLAVGQANAEINAGIKDALAASSRSAVDKALDEKRKPDEVLSFLGAKPGMQVLDVFAGGGYYTEILSHVVGPEGKVTMYNNAGWDKFVNKNVTARLENNRLQNVDYLVAPPESLVDREADQYDLAVFVLGMHDIYYVDPENEWVPIDRKRFLQGIYHVLKSGAVLGIVDHNARAGSDPAVSGKSLHRIDPAVVIKDVESVGFKLEAQSNILRNPDDNLDMLVFDPSVRRNTDRSVLRFRK